MKEVVKLPKGLPKYLTLRTCSRPNCHNIYVPTRWDSKYCGDTCRHVVRVHNNPNVKADVRARQSRREALQRGAGVARLVTQQQVWDKSGGICYYCDLPMIWYKDKAYHADGFTMEHMIPVCKGGNHTIDNLVGAHRHCNGSKNDRSMEELPSDWVERCRLVVQGVKALKRYTIRVPK